ncbi:cell division protein [Erythrobacteraceae bacterium CFH 75059]|uniref:cell division protein FtsX n=1 Tax=Qipengyuania thermophila TaxID=2509361 RepID=UPI0010200196|nr:FtsX-like permease family protein [Qipengyuania thermophila]TCD06412.1 cell division protein [Erythrobacteraceae bacterium CFH 75059]
MRPWTGRRRRDTAGPRRAAREAPLLPATRLGGPMSWILAIMVGLVMLATGAALALNGAGAASRSQLARTATVQIVASDAAVRDRQVRAAAQILAAQDEVASVRVIPPDELHALVAPWLGADLLETQGLPVPGLIDVTTRGPVDEGVLGRLETRLAEVAPAARLDTHAALLAPALGAMTSLQRLALGVVALLAVLGMIAVWLAARSALASSADTVEVVHLLGADDSQIARVFLRSVFPAVVGGSLAGAAGGAAVLWFIARRFSAVEAGLGGGVQFGAGAWALLALVPLAAAGVALLTAWLTVLSALQRRL